MIGQTGLERLLDEYLRGRDGGERIEVDVLGRPVQVIRRDEPRPGGQVVTTVDRRIQEAAERAMTGKAGAVIVLDPNTGDILALTSSPAYDLDHVHRQPRSRGLGRVWSRIPPIPLLNRALQSQYAPGSVFKMVVVAAGLQEQTLTPMDRTYCNGAFHMGQWTFKDWHEGGHGHVDLRSAIVNSCNVFFYQSGLKVGPEAIARYARAFGLGASPAWTWAPRSPGWCRPPRAGAERRRRMARRARPSTCRSARGSSWSRRCKWRA